MFQHILITRLNLGYIKRCAGKGADPENWLKSRLLLFYDVCLPSIMGQSNLDFKWFIFLDSETPNEAIREFEKKTNIFPQIKLILYAGTFGSWGPNVYDLISEFLPFDLKFLISTRIDSDDVIHGNYLCKIQSYFQFQEYLPINFDKGYLLDCKTGILCNKENCSNPFISLIEKRNNNRFKTVYYKMHHEYISDEFLLRIKGEERFWCMLMHSNNDSSSFRGLVKFANYRDFYRNFNFRMKNNPNFLMLLKAAVFSFGSKLSERLMYEFRRIQNEKFKIN